MSRRLVWFIPIVAIFFVRVWIGWGLVAASIVAPACALIGIAIGLLIVRRRRRRSGDIP